MKPKKIVFVLLVVEFVLLFFPISTIFAQVVSQDTSFYIRNLYYGMKGNTDVVNLQKFLKDLGYFSGPITGNFGPLTFSAVKKFQLSRRVNSTGYWGPLSRAVAKTVKQIITQPTAVSPSVQTVQNVPTSTPVSTPSSTVTPASTTPLAITTTSIPSATAGASYSVSIAPSGGTGSYSWWVSAGSLPPGLSLVPTQCTGPSCSVNATIFGTPVTAWTYKFTVSVRSGTQVALQEFTLVINPSVTAIKISPAVPSSFSISQTFETQALYTPAPVCDPTNPCSLPDSTAVGVTWTSSNNAVATIAYKYYDPTSGVITAISPGMATITANYAVGNINLTATIPIFVAGTINSSFQIVPKSPSVIAGNTIFLQAAYTPQYSCLSTSCFSAGSSAVQAVWTSSNNTVATVAYKSNDPKFAVVTGILPGVVTITATVGYTSAYGTALTASTGLIITPAQ